MNQIEDKINQPFGTFPLAVWQNIKHHNRISTCFPLRKQGGEGIVTSFSQREKGGQVIGKSVIIQMISKLVL